MSSVIAPGVVEIDTRLGGWERVTAGYLIAGQRPLLVETGSQSSVPVLLEALAELGVAPSELAGVAVTHIHLDHAGGVGDVARAFPAATVYVHGLGARHLVDPHRLIASAAMVYGDQLDSLYGRLDPTPAERITVLGDGEAIGPVGEGFLDLVVTVGKLPREGVSHRHQLDVPRRRNGLYGGFAPAAATSNQADLDRIVTGRERFRETAQASQDARPNGCQ